MKYRDGFLIQVALYAIVWLLSEYVGLLLCLITATILTAILIISFIVEKIEKSKVPKSYFIWMFISIWPPLIVSLFFTILYEGNFEWMNS